MGMRGLSLACLPALLLAAGFIQASEPKQKEKPELTVEVAFVDISQAVVEQLEQQGLLKKQSKGKDVLSLDKEQMKRFLTVAQSDIHANVMQSPRLTVLNGQTAAINITDEQHFTTGLEIVSRDGRIEYRPQRETIPLGVRLGLRCDLSADRRSVRVHLNTKLTSLTSSEAPRFPIQTPAPNGKEGQVTHWIEQPQVNKFAMNRTMVIPEGNTAVLRGPTRTEETRNEYGPPILSKIPVIQRMVCTVGYGRRVHNLFVLVTPRVLDKQEMEEAPSCKAVKNRTVLPCPCVDPYDGFRTPILGRYTGQDPLCSLHPSEARILRAMPPAKRLPGVYEESRDNIQIVTERVIDKLDPLRFFPLVGKAQLHHCHWKCTVSYDETITVGYPFYFRGSQARKQVVYIDNDHLHQDPADKPQSK